MLEPKCTSTAAKNSVLSFVSSLLPWAPTAGAAGWISGRVRHAQDVACAGEDLSLNWLLQHHLHTPHLEPGKRGRPQCPFLENRWKLIIHKGWKERRVVVGARADKSTLLSESSAYWQAVSLCTHISVPLEGNRLASLPLFQFLSF